MPAPLDPAVREAIEADIREGKTRNAIARAHGVSGSTVSKIAKTIEEDTGSPPFEQSQTKRARERRSDDLVSARVELAHRLMDRAFWLEEQIDQERPFVVRTKDGSEVVMSAPEPKDIQAFMTSVAIAVDKVGVLTRDDTDGVAAVDAWLRSITGIDG